MNTRKGAAHGVIIGALSSMDILPTSFLYVHAMSGYRLSVTILPSSKAFKRNMFNKTGPAVLREKLLYAD